MEKKTALDVVAEKEKTLGLTMPYKDLIYQCMYDYLAQESSPLKDKIKELESEIEILEAEVSEVGVLKSQIESLNEDLETIRHTNSEYCKEIESLELDNERLKQMSVNKGLEIESLQKQLEEHDNDFITAVNDYSAELNERKKEIIKLQSDLTRMRERNESLKSLLATYVELDPEIHNNSLTIKILNKQAKSLLSNKEETNQDTKSERLAGVDKIYSCLSDIQRTTSPPFDKSNKIIVELLKIKDSLVKIKSL